MLKTEKETAQARAKVRGKNRRAKAKAKTASPKQDVSRLETRPMHRKVRHRKAAPEVESITAGLTSRLALLEPSFREAMSRLEARIPTDIYEVMERAATLRGLTMTAYVTTTMWTDARRTIEESSILKLSRDDQTAFAKALLDPPAPNAKLIAAGRRHAALIR